MSSVLSRAARTLLVVSLPALPVVALAHAGADGGGHHALDTLMTGLMHPLTGADHLLAMLAVGLWAAASGRADAGRAQLALPASFVALLLGGALLARDGVALPAIEPMIVASLVALGLLVALRRQLPTAVGAALVAGFALFHGAAHGQELSGGMALAGMVAATAALHAAGWALGQHLRDRTAWLRGIGAAVAVAGGGLLFA